MKKEEEEDNDKPDRFKMLLDVEGHHCRDCRLLQMMLLLPTKETTPWQKLYASGHDPALITGTGLDYECFGELLHLFQHYFNDFTPWAVNGYIKPRLTETRGRKQMVDAATCMSLALTYTRTNGSLILLQCFLD
jgi:hypothetical protein